LQNNLHSVAAENIYTSLLTSLIRCLSVVSWIAGDLCPWEDSIS